MKPTLFLALTSMLNVLTGTNSARKSRLVYPKFETNCLIYGIPIERYSNTSAITITDIPTLTMNVTESDPVLLKNTIEGFLITPKNSNNHATLSSGPLKPDVLKYVQSFVQFQTSDTENKVKGLHVVFYQKSKNKLYDLFNNVVFSICLEIGKSSNFEFFKEDLEKVPTFGSETETKAASVRSSYDIINDLTYYYFTPIECTNEDNTYHFIHIQSPICANMTQTEYDYVRNITNEVMKIPNTLKRINNIDTFKIYGIKEVLMP